MIYKNKRDREAWSREKNIESLKANSFLELGDIILVAETGNFYKVVSEVTDIPLQKELYAKVIPSELIGNIETASKLKNPVNINLIGNVSGVTSFDGSEDVDINVKVKQLETPRVIGLEGNVTGSATFDGTKDINIDVKVKQLEIARTISLSGEVSGSAEFDGSDNTNINASVTGIDASKIKSGVLNTARIPNLDASKITSGIIDIERLPAAALERLVEVENDVERFALTKSQIQLGDVVKVNNTLKMYKVIDDNKLNLEEGYSVFVAGRAAEVPWSGVTGKPNNYPPSSHTHTKGQITDFPTSLKNPTAITIQANGTSLGSYDGSSAKTFNITASNVGASASNHTHTAGAVGAYTKAEVDNKLSGKANSSHGNHVPATQSANNKVYLRNDNTWHTITPSDIGAQPAGSYASSNHTHNYLPLTGGTLSGSLTVTGNLNAGKVYNAVFNDYAEFFERGEETEPGDIISLDLNSDKEIYVKASIENNFVVGVHSNSFAHLIGGEIPPENEDFFNYNIKKFIPVGLAGRVKCKVQGKVKKGDYIVLGDIKGVGIVSDKRFYNVNIIGYSLEEKVTDDIGLVKILIK
jgi:hypothetical protein